MQRRIFPPSRRLVVSWALARTPSAYAPLMRLASLLAAAALTACASAPAASSGGASATPAPLASSDVRSTALGTVTVRDSTFSCPNDPPQVGTGGNLYFGYQVERQAAPLGTQPKPTPAAERSEQRARVDVMFVISEQGRVELPTVKLVSSTDRLDTQAVCELLPRLAFRAASTQGRPVRMWHSMSFAF